MYDLTQTIVAVSSAGTGPRFVVRLSGPQTLDLCRRFFRPAPERLRRAVVAGSVLIDEQLEVPGYLYMFASPRSYTGEDLAELHVLTSRPAVELLVSRLCAAGARQAGPGEFTARAFLNGKMDLAQAEAVNEMIVSSNRTQLAAAQQLLSGRLSQTAEQIRGQLLELTSLIEAGLDFSDEPIEFISRQQCVDRLGAIRRQLELLLAGSIGCESVIEMPAVGIAGAPNAGKSSLLNRLLGTERSIVCAQRKTTRDVLSGILSLSCGPVVLFDCAGLLLEAEDVLDRLAQQAALEALAGSVVVLFCVELGKADWDEDLGVYELIRPRLQHSSVIFVATKSDLAEPELQRRKLAVLREQFGGPFVPCSALVGDGIEALRNRLQRRLVSVLAGPGEGFAESVSEPIGLTSRHKQAVIEAIANLDEALQQAELGNEEIIAMLLRRSWQVLFEIGHEHFDEQVLGRIFSRFCIGK